MAQKRLEILPLLYELHIFIEQQKRRFCFFEQLLSEKATFTLFLATFEHLLRKKGETF